MDFGGQNSAHYEMDTKLISEISSLIKSLNCNKKVTENLQVLQAIIENYLHKVPVCAIESNLLQGIFPKMKVYINIMFEDITKVVQDKEAYEKLQDLLETIIQILNICREIMEHIKSFNKIDVCSIKSVPITLLDILLSTFSHCRISNNLYAEYFERFKQMLTSLFKTAQNVQSLYLFICTNNLNFEEDIDTLVEVLDRMALVGEILPDLNAKAMADQWKGYATLVQRNTHNLQSRLQISFPLKCLIKQIESNMCSVLKMDISSDENFKLCINTLKASNFILTVILKLSESLHNDSKFPNEEILLLMVILNRYSSPYLHLNHYPGKLINSIESYVTNAGDVLLDNFINNKKFIQCYLDSEGLYVNDADMRIGFVFLSLSLIKGIILKDSLIAMHINSSWIGDHLLQMTFRIIPLCNTELMCNLSIPASVDLRENRRFTNLYEVLLIHLATIAINCTCDYFRNVEKLLLENVLQSNFWKATLAIDIWCIVDRYGTDMLTFQHVNFLFNISKSFLRRAYFIPESIYVNEALRRLYMLLSNESKLKLVQKYPLEVNLDVWTNIGLNNISDKTLVQKCATVLLKKVLNRLENSKSKLFSIEEWNFMCTEISSLSNLNSSDMDKIFLNQILSAIFQMWSLNFSFLCLKENGVFHNFILCLLEVNVKYIKYYNNSQLLHVLQQIQLNLNLNIVFQLLVLQHLKELSTKQIENSFESKQILQLIAELFHSLLTGDDLFVKERAFEIFVEFSHVTKHENIVAMTVKSNISLRMSIAKYIQRRIEEERSLSSKDYYDMQENVKFKHICRNSRFVVNEEPLKKKSKVASDVNIEIVVDRIQSDARLALKYYSSDSNELSPQITTELIEVIKTLQKIVHK